MAGEQTRAAAAGGGVSSAEYGRTASFLAIGVGLTGLITYVYFFVASHVLSTTDYGQIAVVWSAVFITVSTLYRPVDQLLSRHISENLAKGEPPREPIRVAIRIQLGLAVGFAAVALILRGPIEDGLLSGNETLYWVFLLAVLFYAASYFARGYLAGYRRFGLFATMILSESVFRTSFAVLVAVGLLSGQSAVAIGIVAAPSLSLLVVPAVFARRARSAPSPPPPEAKRKASEFSMGSGTGFVAAVLVIMLGEQIFLNAGPLIVRGLEGAAAAGFIFNVLMIARAPLQLFQAVSTSILPHLTSLHASAEEGSEAEFRRSVRMVLAAIAAFTAVAAIVFLVAGPQLMQLAFSDKFSYDRPGLLLVTLGMGLYLSSVTVNQACLAQGQVRRAAARWALCAAFFVAWCFLAPIGDEFRRIEIGFAAAALLLLGLLFAIYRRPHERPEDVPTAGSGEELETQLAAADEGA
ncbi:MAG TPA: oligosaccharide flippase family protein [Solirubrobacterales bacterium]|nr:oligosaccharide flippase family protein [Solirubrobacterales bacterium]